MKFICHLLLASMLLFSLASAYAKSDIKSSDPLSVLFRGSKLVPRSNVLVPANETSVFIQNGQAMSKEKINLTAPFCVLQTKIPFELDRVIESEIQIRDTAITERGVGTAFATKSEDDIASFACLCGSGTTCEQPTVGLAIENLRGLFFLEGWNGVSYSESSSTIDYVYEFRNPEKLLHRNFAIFPERHTSTAPPILQNLKNPKGMHRIDFNEAGIHLGFIRGQIKLPAEFKADVCAPKKSWVDEDAYFRSAQKAEIDAENLARCEILSREFSKFDDRGGITTRIDPRCKKSGGVYCFKWTVRINQ